VTSSKKSNRFNVVDLFSGVGGLSYGFAKRTDFDVVAANEILPAMANAYQKNHPKTKMYNCDIADFTGNLLETDLGSVRESIHVVVGGPPCQAYSTVGKRSPGDPRSQLFKQYFRILEELQPKIFVYENVRGIMSMDIFRKLIEEFSSLGYAVQYQLLNAADFGVPQLRKRIIIVGTLNGYDFKYPNPTHQDPNQNDGLLKLDLPPWRTLSDAIGDLPKIQSGESAEYYASDPQNEFQRKMRLQAPETLMDHNAALHNPRLIELMEALPEGGGQRDLPKKLLPTSGYANTYARLWWDKPCTTITRNLGTPSSSRCIHPHVARGLTTREGARIQGFPDHYVFSGSRSDRNLQIGNAVPTLLSDAIAKQVLKTLKNSL
jgi:DNA (cytosine-5)-methyltransferase 1